MSRQVEQVYERCLSSPIDSLDFEWDDLVVSAFKLQRDWGKDFSLPGKELMLRGIVRASIVPDGKWWRLPELGERGARRAWLLPVHEGEAMIELIAFAATGSKQAGGPWFLVGSVDALGLDGERHAKTLTIFTQPYEWLMHWLKCCRANPAWLSAPETGPESCAALVLERARINWRPFAVEPAGVTSGTEEVHCADDPALAEYIARAQAVSVPKLPIVTRRRPKPKQEVSP